MAFQRLEPAGPRLLSAPANSLAARRFRLSQRLILISSVRCCRCGCCCSCCSGSTNWQDCWPCCRLALFRTKSKDRSLSMSENLLLAFAFWIDRCRLFAPGGWFMFYYTHFASLCKTEIFRRLSQGEPPDISPLCKIYSLFKLCERSVVHFIDSP